MLINSTENARDWLGLGMVGFGVGIMIQIVPFFHAISILEINQLEILPFIVCLVLGSGLIILAIIGSSLDSIPNTTRPQLLDLVNASLVIFVIFSATYLITVSIFPIFQFLPDFRIFSGPMIFVVGEGTALILIVILSFTADVLFN